MGSINIIKSLSIFLQQALSIIVSSIKRNFCERHESNPGSLGERQESYLYAVQHLYSEMLIESKSVPMKLNG